VLLKYRNSFTIPTKHNKRLRISELDREEVNRARDTFMNVPYDELEMLFERFKEISSLITDDGLIDVREFCALLDLRMESHLTRRLFDLIDENGDRFINFPEFVRANLMLGPNSSDLDRLKFSFQVFDLNGDGYISKEELLSILKDSLEESLLLTDDQMMEMVDSTFNEVDLNKDGKISFEEYQFMSKRHPMIVESLNFGNFLM